MIHFIKTLQDKIGQALQLPAAQQVQRVSTEQQRVIPNTQNIDIPRLTIDSPIMQSWNPTSKRAIKSTPRIHWRTTRNNNPGQAALITKPQNNIINEAQGMRQLQQLKANKNKAAYTGKHAPPETFTPIPTRA